MKYVNLDADLSAFFDRELEHVKAKVYEVAYTELNATTAFDVSTEAGPAAESITYQQFDQVGVAQIISNYTKALPRVDIFGKEFNTPVRSIGDEYGYSLQEVRASASTGRNLPQRKANAARRAIEQKINDIAFFADNTKPEWAGLSGILYNANVTKGKVTVGATSGKYLWEEKTADEMLFDLNKGVRDVITLTGGVEVPDTIGLPVGPYSIVSTTPRSANSDTTVLQFFLKNNPMIKNVIWMNELEDVNPIPSTGVATATNVMIVYKKSLDNQSLEIPQPFEQLDVEQRGLEYTIPCHARCGGMIVYKPLSINIVEGI